MLEEGYYDTLEGQGHYDYEIYLNTKTLFSAQKRHHQLCNHDELMFQIVHQVEELWMKLIGYTVVDIVQNIEKKNTLKVTYFFKRVHAIQRLMINQMDLLDIMSPHDYQQIRLVLGNGSGIESPGFRNIKKIATLIWDKYFSYYLDAKIENIEKIYDIEYTHDERYVIAENLIDFDQLFQTFLQRHFLLVARNIGIDANSLKGRPNEYLATGTKRQFYPELWKIRGKMTNDWSDKNGLARESIKNGD